MKRIVVDCQTGRQVEHTLSAEEEAARLVEIVLAEEQFRQEERKRIKAQLLQAAGDLERAQALRDEGVLGEEDVVELEGKVERLKGEWQGKVEDIRYWGLGIGD